MSVESSQVSSLLTNQRALYLQNVHADKTVNFPSIAVGSHWGQETVETLAGKTEALLNARYVRYCFDQIENICRFIRCNAILGILLGLGMDRNICFETLNLPLLL